MLADRPTFRSILACSVGPHCVAMRSQHSDKERNQQLANDTTCKRYVRVLTPTNQK